MPKSPKVGGPAIEKQKSYNLGRLIVHPELNEFKLDGKSIHLDPLLMDILCHLIDNAPDIVSSNELLDRFWQGMVVEESTVHRRISQLRQALGDKAKNPIYIATVPKRGYRIVAEVSEVESQSADAEGNTEKTIGQDHGKARKPQLLFTFAVLIAVALLGWAGFQLFPNSADDRQLPPKIAVLPFQDFSEIDSSRLASGFQEDIITKLAKNSELRVTSRTSVQRYDQSTARSIPDIARELTATHIIEGSLRRSNNHVRVTIQLIEAATDEHIWTEAYDRELSDIFEIQNEIAQEVADQLSLAFSTSELDRLSYRPTNDLEAYELVLQGRKLIDVGTMKSLTEAAVLMKEATDRDPGLAEAHAGLARALFLQTFLGVPQADVRDIALRSTQRALELDPDSGYIQANHAHILGQFQSDTSTASIHYKKALELEPNNSFALLHYGAFFRGQGKPDLGLPYLERAIILNPLSGEVSFYLALALLDLGLRDQAYEIVKKGVKFDPEDIDLLGLEAELSFDRGEPFEAFKHLRELFLLDPDNIENLAGLVYPLLFLGEFEAMNRWVARMGTISSTHPTYLNAQLIAYAVAGDVSSLDRLASKWQTQNTDNQSKRAHYGSGSIFGVFAQIQLSDLKADAAREKNEPERERLLRQTSIALARAELLANDELGISWVGRNIARSLATNLRLMGDIQASQDIEWALIDALHEEGHGEASPMILCYALLGETEKAISLIESKQKHLINLPLLNRYRFYRFPNYEKLFNDPRFLKSFELHEEAQRLLAARLANELPDILDATVGL